MPVVVSSLSPHSLLGLLSILALTAAVRLLVGHFLFKRNRAPYPPGPKPRWLIGNLFDIPTKNIPQEYIKWGKMYNSMYFAGNLLIFVSTTLNTTSTGDILHASALGNHIVVLNKRADVEELFERRAAIYSDRPPIHILSLWVSSPSCTPNSNPLTLHNGRLGWDYNFAFLSYGPAWRLHRKICKQNFGLAGVRQYYEPIIANSVGHALRGLLENPAMFEDCCKT